MASLSRDVQGERAIGLRGNANVGQRSNVSRIEAVDHAGHNLPYIRLDGPQHGIA